MGRIKRLRIIKTVAIMFIALTLFSSCSLNRAKGKNKEEANIDDSTNELSAMSFLPIEINGKNSANNTILSSEYLLYKNKIYFRTNDNGIPAVNMYSFIDLDTWESGCICPDPLCSHRDPNICMYINFVSKPYFTDENYMFAVRDINSVPLSIWKYDLNNNKASIVYTARQTEPIIIGISNGILYFTDSNEIIDEKTVRKETWLIGLDSNRNEIVYEKKLDEIINIHLIHDGLLYFDNHKELYVSDLDFTKKHIMDLKGDVCTWCFDEQNNAFYFDVIDQKERTGKLYVYKNECVETIPLPADNIYYFQITESEIYYSEYAPIYYGRSVFEPHNEVYDYTGGKIFSVRRENTDMNPCLVFNNNGEHVICIAGVSNYCVLNGKLFYDIIGTTRFQIGKDEYINFDLSKGLSKAVYDLTTNTEEIISFGQ